MTTITRSIATGSDDAYLSDIFIPSRTYSVTSSTISNNYSSGDVSYIIGRFTNITIPQWTTITNAVLKFTASSTKNVTYKASPFWSDIDANTFGLRAIETDNVSTFSDWGEPWDYSSQVVRDRWTNSFVNNTEYTTTDISSLIQTVVDRVWWVSWNAIAILFSNPEGFEYSWNWLEIYSYDWDPAKAMEIEITYDDPTPPSTYSKSKLLMFF